MSQELSEAKLYDQWCADIRATDEISFKLIGIVPLVSGTGLLTIFLTNGQLPPEILIALSLFAAAVTLGLFRWELRNIQTCAWLIYYVGELERTVLDGEPVKKNLGDWPKPPQGIGKTEAEKFIYTVTIVTWLALPFLLLTYNQLGPWTWGLCGFVSFVIAVATVISLRARVRPPRNTPTTRPPDSGG